MPANNNDLEKRLWDAADELRANSRLRAAEYSAPVLGLIFLRYADHRFAAADAAIQAERAEAAEEGRRQRPVSPLDYQARYQLQPGTLIVSSSPSPVESPTGGQVEEEAWINQESRLLLKYTGRLVFTDEEGAEWEITITLRAGDIDQSCPITLEIPGDAVIEEW